MQLKILQVGAPCSDLLVYAHIDGSFIKPLVPSLTEDAVVSLYAGPSTSYYKGAVLGAAGTWPSFVAGVEKQLGHAVRRHLLVSWSAGSQVALEAVQSPDPPDAVVMLDGLYGQKPAGSKPGDGQVVPSPALDALVDFAVGAARRTPSPRGGERVLVIFHSRIATSYASSKECAEYVQRRVEALVGPMQPDPSAAPAVLDGHKPAEALVLGNLRIVEFAGADTKEHVREAHLWDEVARLWVPWITDANVCGAAGPTIPAPPPSLPLPSIPTVGQVRELRLTSPRMKGEDVRAWQVFLQEEGLELVADGDFGPVTDAKTRVFQTAHVLPVTGVVDGTTLGAAATGPRVFAPTPNVPPAPVSTERVRGLDVARYQGKVNWPAIYGIGGRFAFCKSTEGTSWVDPRFGENVDGVADARDAGLLSGSYHYFLPQHDARAQAAHYHKVAGGRVDLPPVMDWETLGGVSPRIAALRARDFVLETERLWGMRAIIYTYPFFWQSLLDAGALDAELLAFFAERDLWIAHYMTTRPRVPRPWQRWTFWQFDGDGGLVMPNGVDADFNVFNGGEADLRAWLASYRTP